MPESLNHNGIEDHTISGPSLCRLDVDNRTNVANEKKISVGMAQELTHLPLHVGHCHDTHADLTAGDVLIGDECKLKRLED